MHELYAESDHSTASIKKSDTSATKAPSNTDTDDLRTVCIKKSDTSETEAPSTTDTDQLSHSDSKESESFECMKKDDSSGESEIHSEYIPESDSSTPDDIPYFDFDIATPDPLDFMPYTGAKPKYSAEDIADAMRRLEKDIARQNELFHSMMQQAQGVQNSGPTRNQETRKQPQERRLPDQERPNRTMETLLLPAACAQQFSLVNHPALRPYTTSTGALVVPVPLIVQPDYLMAQPHWGCAPQSLKSGEAFEINKSAGMTPTQGFGNNTSAGPTPMPQPVEQLVRGGYSSSGHCDKSSSSAGTTSSNGMSARDLLLKHLSGNTPPAQVTPTIRGPGVQPVRDRTKRDSKRQN